MPLRAKGNRTMLSLLAITGAIVIVSWVLGGSSA
jgi:hypothetical protein